MKALSLFSLILPLFSSGGQLKTETDTERVSETESSGRLDGIQPFPGQIREREREDGGKRQRGDKKGEKKNEEKKKSD
jgi:hypothetical protein